MLQRSLSARMMATSAVLLFAIGCSDVEERDLVALEELASQTPDGSGATSAQPLRHDAWLALHRLARQPRDPGWDAALDSLATHGDGFTLTILEGLDRATLAPATRERLDRTEKAVSERLAKVDDARFAERLPLMLERSAWADLLCDPLETPLRTWTKETVAARLDSPAVRAELQRIEREYTASGPDEVGFGTLTERVRRYAREIQAGA